MYVKVGLVEKTKEKEKKERKLTNNNVIIWVVTDTS
jgi:hypothetical protein